MTPTYTAANLLVAPGNARDPHVVVEVTPELAQWEHINFQVRRLSKGGAWSFATTTQECAIVMLSGSAHVDSSAGTWDIGGRPHVFAGGAYVLYQSLHTSFTVHASSDCEFAFTWVEATTPHAPVLVTPADIKQEIRGGDNATRQINQLMPPGFACERLVLVEVYTPSGSWSSYPPHKHDRDALPDESELEETYYHRMNPPQGYAMQRVYTDDRSLNETICVQDRDVVLVPRGYHPVGAAHGYDLWYLNVMAGPRRIWRFHNDPAHAWMLKR
jgi:5-deoxy-glucuronate isomerase